MLLINGRVVTMDSSFSIIGNGAIRIGNGRILDMGPTDVLTDRYPSESVTDVEDRLIMPGNICGHTHFYGAFARGLGIPGKPPAHFLDILQKLWWKLDKALTPEGIKYSALVCLIDAIRHGTTTLIDHHASPSCIDGSLDIIAQAVNEAGLRACLSYEVTDRNGSAQALAGIRENIRFIQRCRDNPSPSLAASFGLHASLTLSDSTLDRCRSEISPEDTGFHTHAAEGFADQIDSIKKTGLRVIQRMKKHDLLGGKTILAHCIHINDEEIEIIASSGCRVTHQPRSNMNNAVGSAPVDKMLARGIPVSMGNDGFSNNMWAEWKAAYLLHKLVSQDPRAMQGFDIMKLGITNNATLAHLYWSDLPVGTIQPGASADLVLVDYHPFTPMDSSNLPWHILFGMESDMIHSTMAQGCWLMKNRELTGLDEERIIAEANRVSRIIWDRFQEENWNS